MLIRSKSVIDAQTDLDMKNISGKADNILKLLLLIRGRGFVLVVFKYPLK